MGGSALVSGAALLAAIGLALAGRYSSTPSLAAVLPVAAWAVVPGSLLYLLVGAIRAKRDMAGASLALNLVVPLALLGGVAGALLSGSGVAGSSSPLPVRARSG